MNLFYSYDDSLKWDNKKFVYHVTLWDLNFRKNRLQFSDWFLLFAGLQINIWLDRTFVRSLLILLGHNLNLVGQKPTPLNLVGHIYVTRYIYVTSGATLNNMLECLVNFIAKCKLSEFAIRFCHSKKCDIFFCDLTNVRSKSLLLRHLPNLVGHCPMSDSNLQPCIWESHQRIC
jgi:hypothetical protein